MNEIINTIYTACKADSVFRVMVLQKRLDLAKELLAGNGASISSGTIGDSNFTKDSKNSLTVNEFCTVLNIVIDAIENDTLPRLNSNRAIYN